MDTTEKGLEVDYQLTSAPSKNRAALAEPVEPVAHQRQPLLVHRVVALAAALLLPQQAGLLEDAQVPRGGGPLVRKACGDGAGRDVASAKVNRQQDLSPRRMPQRGDDLIQRLQLLFGGQRSSTSQMRRSASTGPIGSHTAITSGVWCATSDALPSFHTKYSTIECSPLRMLYAFHTLNGSLVTRPTLRSAGSCFFTSASSSSSLPCFAT